MHGKSAGKIEALSLERVGSREKPSSSMEEGWVVVRPLS